MKKPDKYPLIDPHGPDLYGSILRTAEQLRRQRRLDQEAGMFMARQREAAARLAIQRLEADEPVVVMVPTQTPSLVHSGALQPDPASVD